MNPFITASIILNGRKHLQNHSGMVLMSALTILLVLVVIGIGAGVMLRNDLTVLGNLRRSTESFYFSVAGLEWGKNELKQIASFPPVLQNGSQQFSFGAFAVAFEPPDVLTPLTARMVLRATGKSYGAEQIIQAQLTKSYELADAALVVRGNAAAANFSAADILISGIDHDPATGKPKLPTKSRNAVSTADARLQQLLADAIGSRSGLLESAAGLAAMAASSYLPVDFVAQLTQDLCGSASAVVHALPVSSIQVVENQLWGSRMAPQSHCFNGASGSGDGLELGANVNGAGILVVQNADLLISGSFRWEGLIIVTGSDVSLKTAGADAKDILGAVIANETGIPGSERKLLDIQGSLRVLFTRQTLSAVVKLLPDATLKMAHDHLPSTVSQDYWRVVSQ